MARRRVLAVALVASIAASVGGSVCSMGVAIGAESKWVKAFYGGDNEAMALANSRMRTLDLFCGMLALLTAGTSSQFQYP